MLLTIDRLATQFAGLAVESQALILILSFISLLAVLEQVLSLGLRTLLVLLFIGGVLTAGAAAITVGYQLLAFGQPIPILL